jgi:hypothetical protein
VRMPVKNQHPAFGQRTSDDRRLQAVLILRTLSSAPSIIMAAAECDCAH